MIIVTGESMHTASEMALHIPAMGVSIHWTGLLDWITGLDYWTGLLDWITGLDYWTGLLDSYYFCFLMFLLPNLTKKCFSN